MPTGARGGCAPRSASSTEGTSSVEAARPRGIRGASSCSASEAQGPQILKKLPEGRLRGNLLPRPVARDADEQLVLGPAEAVAPGEGEEPRGRVRVDKRDGLAPVQVPEPDARLEGVVGKEPAF